MQGSDIIGQRLANLSQLVGVMGETLDRNGTLVNYLDVES
jgi:hypothetical protein